jgi:predicted GIY-YIG superfamily endonuclease
MNTKYYTYILECNDGTRYYGHTNNLTRRLKDHLNGRVGFTNNKQPKLIYYKEFNSCSEAYRREMQLKNGRTRRETMKKLIASFALDKMSRV